MVRLSFSYTAYISRLSQRLNQRCLAFDNGSRKKRHHKSFWILGVKIKDGGFFSWSILSTQQLTAAKRPTTSYLWRHNLHTNNIWWGGCLAYNQPRIISPALQKLSRLRWQPCQRRCFSPQILKACQRTFPGCTTVLCPLANACRWNKRQSFGVLVNTPCSRIKEPWCKNHHTHATHYRRICLLPICYSQLFENSLT